MINKSTGDVDFSASPVLIYKINLFVEKVFSGASNALFLLSVIEKD